jgi:hypothetical protein
MKSNKEVWLLICVLTDQLKPPMLHGGWWPDEDGKWPLLLGSISDLEIR